MKKSFWSSSHIGMRKIEALKGVTSNRGGQHHSIMRFLRIGMRVKK